MQQNQINRLKVVLVEQGRTEKWISEKLGKAPSTVSKLCSNKIQSSLEIHNKIAALLGVEHFDLILKSK